VYDYVLENNLSMAARHVFGELLLSVPFLTIYLGGQLPPPGKEFAPPVKPFLPPKCEAELLMIAVRIAVVYLIIRLWHYALP
jgi:hypothetical protein